MAGKNTISISFEVTDGRDGLKTLTLDADALRKVMEQNVRVSQNMQEEVLGLAAAVTVAKGVSGAFGQLSGLFGKLTGESLEFGNAAILGVSIDELIIIKNHPHFNLTERVHDICCDAPNLNELKPAKIEQIFIFAKNNARLIDVLHL
ncbi:MAG: hypothetical protein Q4C37_00955 [Bacteroidales bacterium]|nr:hypothetical protein [Bacteroidales bacterium]